MINAEIKLQQTFGTRASSVSYVDYYCNVMCFEAW